MGNFSARQAGKQDTRPKTQDPRPKTKNRQPTEVTRHAPATFSAFPKRTTARLPLIRPSNFGHHFLFCKLLLFFSLLAAPLFNSVHFQHNFTILIPFLLHWHLPVQGPGQSPLWSGLSPPRLSPDMLSGSKVSPCCRTPKQVRLGHYTKPKSSLCTAWTLENPTTDRPKICVEMRALTTTR